MKDKGRKWASYEKEIADDNYYYARSCVRQNFFPASETIFLKILREELGKDIFDDYRQTSCTGIAYHSGIVPFETTMTVVARQFALMTEAGYKNLVCSCVTSFGIYLEVLETWKHFPEEEEKARKALLKSTGKIFRLPENVVHTSDIIYKFRKEIAEKAKNRMVNHSTGEPLKIADHIGCHYAKIFPQKGIGGAEYPYVLAGMIEEWGGQQVDYPERRHCCGFGFRQYLIKENRGYSLSNSKRKFESLQHYHPDLISDELPRDVHIFLIAGNMSSARWNIRPMTKKDMGFPVLTYEEFAGLVLAYDPWDLGIQLHQVDVEPLLMKLGINYNPSAKYLGLNGVNLGQPVKPEFLKSYQ